MGAAMGANYPDYYNMMLNPLAVQQAAAAAAATMTLQQSMLKDAPGTNPLLNPLLYGQPDYDGKGKGKGGGGGPPAPRARAARAAGRRTGRSARAARAAGRRTG